MKHASKIGNTVLVISRPSRRLIAADTGGKGWNLLRLRRLGFRVPPFVIFSSRMFAECAGERRGDIDAQLKGLRAEDREGIMRASVRVRDIITGLPMSDQVMRSVYRAFDRLAGKDGLVSVRSSVAGEDGTEHSFAGQMDSKLNVPRHMVTLAVRQVWASAFSARALAYRLRAGLPLLDVRIAVVLQVMLQAEASGVLFTRDPVSGARQCVVTAGYGLGEGVVSDRVETDTYRCPLDGRDVQADVAEKTRAMCRTENGSGGVRLMPVDPARRGARVLSDVEVLQLRDWGMQLESASKAPVDVEWARAEDGGLFLLQVRPVTTRTERTPNMQVWDNANIVESYPGITSPLTFSFIREAYERAFRGAVRGFLLRPAPLQQVNSVLASLLGHVHGRVYYNLRNWYTMLSVLPGFKRNKKAWDQMIGIAHALEIPAARLSPLDRAGTALKCAWRLLRVRGNAREFHRAFTQDFRRWSAMDITRADGPALRRQYAMLAEEAPRIWPRTLYNDFAAMTWYDLLKRCCARWHCSDGLHNRLLCAEPGIESVQPVRALVGMAEAIREDKALTALFAGSSDAEILTALREDGAYASLRDFLRDYLARYGDRGFEELKLESHSYRDDPAALIGMLRGYVRSGMTTAGMEREETRTREAAERELRDRIRNPFARLLTRIVLDRARAAVAARENMRFSRSRLYGLLRRMFRRLASILSAQGVIAHPDDIFFLEVQEVFALVEKTLPPAEARRIVARRRQAQAADAELELPSRFMRDGNDGAVQQPQAAEAVTTQDLSAPQLRGTGCSTGMVTAPCAVVREPSAAGDVAGKILVARSTDPGWVFLMISAAGLIVEQGSVLSHTAIIGRELGIPTIVAANDAMRLLEGAKSVTMNGATGEISWK